MPVRTSTIGNRVDSVQRVLAFGNSLLAGGYATTDRSADPSLSSSRDIMTRLAASLKASEINYAINGGVMWFITDLANDRYGVVAQVKQTSRRPIRASSTLTAGPSAAATSVTVTAAAARDSGMSPAFSAWDLIHIGNGNPADATTGGEVIRINAIATNTLGLEQNENGVYAAGLVRAHSNTDPVFVVPWQYESTDTLAIICEVHNAAARRRPDSTHQTWYQDALRSTISHLRLAEIFEPNHASLVFAGTWSATVASPNGSGSVNSVSGAQGLKQPTATSSTVTWHVANNFPGGTAMMSWVSNLSASATVSFTVDGVSAGSLTLPAAPTAPTGQTVLNHVKRLTGLSAGRHLIVATVTSLGTGNIYFDYAGLEAPVPPLVVVMKGHRTGSYQLYSSSHEYGHMPTTLSAAPASGATTVQVAQTNAFYRQISASAPATGDTITLDPRGSKREVLTVNGTPTVAGANWNIPVTPALSLNTHTIGETVHMGVQDADLTTMNGWIDTVVAEFDSYVVPYNADNALAGSNGWPDSQYFVNDGVHFSDYGHSRVAEDIENRLRSMEQLNTRVSARKSMLTAAKPSQEVTFLATGAALTWAVPSAVTEFGGSANFRRVFDFNRYKECRLAAVQPVVSTSGGRLRAQYSFDGTNWYYLNRKTRTGSALESKTDWAEPTAAGDNMLVQLDTGTGTGLKFSSWGFIYPDALTDVYLRVVGIGGGAASSTWMALWLEVR